MKQHSYKNRQRYHSDLCITALGGIYNSRVERPDSFAKEIYICEGLNSYRHFLCNIPENPGKSRKCFVEFERKKIARNIQETIYGV